MAERTGAVILDESKIKITRTDQKPTLHLAWTVDDGPTRHTKNMMQVFAARNILVTWYIQRNRLTKQFIQQYLSLQNKHQHEIAIHGIHKKDDHLSWFPTRWKPKRKPNAKISYSKLSTALHDLEEFQKELHRSGLKTKFVRLPYGLGTELRHSLQKPPGQEGLRKAAATAAIKKIVAGRATPASKTATDFHTLEATLKKLRLHLWGGKAHGGVSAVSWQAESAGPRTGRTDNVPEKQITMMRKEIPRSASKAGSCVILCHDTSSRDVKEVERDIKAIEHVAKETSTLLRYHTMSSLYKQVTGKNP